MNKEYMWITQDNNQDFGNEQSIALTTSNGEVYIKGRPINYYGVHGMVFYDNEFHLLEEDDGHFTTCWVVAKQDIKDLHFLLKWVLKTYTKNKDTNYTKGLFNVVVVRRASTHHLLISKLNSNNKLIFDIYWVTDLLKVLEFDPIILNS